MATSDPRDTICVCALVREARAEVERLHEVVGQVRTELAGVIEVLDSERLQHAAEVERLRGLLAEVLPYAHAGAEALDFHEPYGPQEGHALLCLKAAEMLGRIKSGEFE